jgi:hypothetical protein
MRALLLLSVAEAAFLFAGCGTSNQDVSIDGGNGHTGSTSSTPHASGSGSTNSNSNTSSAQAADGGPPSVQFSIDLGRGPARQYQPPAKPAPISPYVYGVNAFAAWQSTTRWGVLRWGGDSFSGWNWTNNFDNSGSDYCFWQGSAGGGKGLAGAITDTKFPSIATDQSFGIPSLVTVPILDFVTSSAVTNNVWGGSTPPCPGTPTCSSGSANGYAANVGNLDFASTNPASMAFVGNQATKGSAFCTCSGSACGSGCSVDTQGAVYEDEFVNYLKVTYGAGAAPVFFSLDNEPNYWPSTHPELWPYKGTPGCGTNGTVTFDDVVSRNTTYAAAIKSVWPEAKVFGPVVAQDGIIYGGNYNDPNLSTTTFTPYYLGKIADASVAASKPLIDAYDIHYYTSNGSTAQCPQVPRMFWDPNFTDFSASATDKIDYGWSGQNDYFDKSLYPRQMIPRMLTAIASAYGGKSTPAPGLSFSEYNPGCETAIEGGVAEADMLGIFGREGVYAATAWPLKSVTDSSGKLTNYLVAAYDLYRNYDGQGSAVGDTAPYAQTSDVGNTSVYAFTHSDDATKLDVVAVNKASFSVTVAIAIAAAPTLTTSTPYQLTNANAGVSAAGTPAPVSCSAGTCQLTYTMPPMSATTLALR